MRYLTYDLNFYIQISYRPNVNAKKKEKRKDGYVSIQHLSALLYYFL